MKKSRHNLTVEEKGKKERGRGKDNVSDISYVLQHPNWLFWQ